MLQENQLFANRYRLVKRLGQGAFSEVWKAEDTKVGNLTVALKVYAPDKGLDEDGAKVFGDEFAIVFNIHHQNLLTPSTFDEENNSPYLVLPYCEKGSATRLIGKMDERQAAQFLHDVSSALAYLHESEIVHQDIKPDNVLMDAKGNFLVTDFGISTRIRSTLRRSVGDKKSAGTTAYMGPERFSKTPTPVKASDVWSLGATVYELMTGDVPFGDMGGGMQKMNAEIPDIPDDYSPELKRLVERCLAPDTWDRPTAAQLLDICEGYLRTGKWDLSPIDGGAKPGNEPQKPPREDRSSRHRPTQRKVTTEQNGDIPPQLTKTPKNVPQKDDSPKPVSRFRKKLLWIICSVAAVVILAVVLRVTFTKEKKAVNISDPEVEALAKTYTVNGASFTMKYVEGGTFKMGSEKDDENEKPVHKVTVSDFCISETEVTMSLWNRVVGERWADCEWPAWVSWYDCQRFCEDLNNKLSEQLPMGYRFALPTEAQWEYAARGGNHSNNSLYSGSNNLNEVAWYSENNDNNNFLYSVKMKKANELGLYDMSGNVWEWCEDYYGDYSRKTQTDPQGLSAGDKRVIRGGSIYCKESSCRVTRRGSHDPYSEDYGIGFRIVLVKQ